MATRIDVQQSGKQTLTAMMMTRHYGGTLDDAIVAQRATMDPQDVKEVEAEFAKLEKKKQS
jgi:hypothetical protein